MSYASFYTRAVAAGSPVGPPDGFTGILPAEDGTPLIVDANVRVTDLGANPFLFSNNGVYVRDGIGCYGTGGERRRYEVAYINYARLDAIRGYGVTGTVRFKIIRVSDGVAVYNEPLNTTGADDNSYVGGLEWTGAHDQYWIEFSHDSGGLIAIDGIVVRR